MFFFFFFFFFNIVVRNEARVLDFLILLGFYWFREHKGIVLHAAF
jgi:hypothetical protein